MATERVKENKKEDRENLEDSGGEKKQAINKRLWRSKKAAIKR